MLNVARASSPPEKLGLLRTLRPCTTGLIGDGGTHTFVRFFLVTFDGSVCELALFGDGVRWCTCWLCTGRRSDDRRCRACSNPRCVARLGNGRRAARRGGQTPWQR